MVLNFVCLYKAYEMIPWIRSFVGIWMCLAMPSNAWKSSSSSRMMRLVCNDVVAIALKLTNRQSSSREKLIIHQYLCFALTCN